MRLSKARKACLTAMMKDAIFEAANAVLEQHGANGFTMDRVAAKAGLATGSLYNYFQGKDDLLQRTYTRGVEPFLQAVSDAAESDRSAPEKLHAILDISLEQAVKHKVLLRLLVGTSQGAQIREDIRPRFLRILVRIFEQGIREGAFRPHNPAHTSRMFQGCLSSLFELQRDGASDEELNEYVGMLIDATVNGFSIHMGREAEDK